MSNKSGFFGDIFGSAEDDPLLQSDQDAFSSPSDDDAQSMSKQQPKSPQDATSSVSSSSDTEAMEVQEVILRQSGSQTNGLAKLNDAVEDGWRVSDVSLDDRIRSASGDVDTQITILMERNTPRSLFDFGGTY